MNQETLIIFYFMMSVFNLFAWVFMMKDRAYSLLFIPIILTGFTVFVFIRYGVGWMNHKHDFEVDCNEEESGIVILKCKYPNCSEIKVY